ncbi:hypothetical protein M419DRAFT_123508 [Trichoderma reesei RUT C-30]|uniref:Uncharacterized protein n=1 Tax=Hypocrea jecorina (strain ATCC 56765 / BCRC 32924 / NRRL 11460 / Rut C-30) TaxID=1344414 RepID=A0A024S8U3_HYPJR|nr:hypothetical protein M419DRAFT_123508 [Trichoderma reesei RUT C-30]
MIRSLSSSLPFNLVRRRSPGTSDEKQGMLQSRTRQDRGPWPTESQQTQQGVSPKFEWARGGGEERWRRGWALIRDLPGSRNGVMC